jgi:hypothetical protein
MPWIPMYLHREDVKALLDWLNNEQEIAFIVPIGSPEHDHAWKAVQEVEALHDGTWSLWHVPGGPLSLPGANFGEPDETIEDPWSGWRERNPGADPRVPWFGGSVPHIIDLELHERGLGKDGKQVIPPEERSDEILGMSSLGWIGQRYRAIGTPAPQATERWWKRLRRWVAKNARRVPRSGPIDGQSPEIYAFPCAFEAIQQGKPRDANPF